MNFLYRENEQIKELLLSIMKEENVTYQELGYRLGTSHQNVHKTINKNTFKFDDVLKICNALGYKMKIDIYKENVNTNSQEEIMLAINQDIIDVYKEMDNIKTQMEKISKMIEEEKINKTVENKE